MASLSVKVDERTKRLMEQHEDINWSAVLRKSIEQKLSETIPVPGEQAKRAFGDAALLRKAYPLGTNHVSETVVRKWRDKRRL